MQGACTPCVHAHAGPTQFSVGARRKPRHTVQLPGAGGHCDLPAVAAEPGEMEAVLLNFVHNPVLMGNATGPISRRAMFEGLRLARPFKRKASCCPDQLADALKSPTIRSLPVEAIIPSMPGEDDLRSISSRSVPPPDSGSTMDSRSLPAFCGLLRR